MGTALTDEQVSELARLASSVLLALDADSAGQTAMLRAAELAQRKGLELRVVPMPADADPAELVQREGAEAMRAAVEGSVMLVRFQVERILAAGDDGSPEGRDRMIDELRPVLATVAPGAVREELLRMISGRFGLREGLTESLLSSASASAPASGGHGAATRGGERATRTNGGSAGAPGRGSTATLDRREETERSFLALCVALPERGREALAAVDLEEHFTSGVVRRAAVHLREHLLAPGEGLPPEDPELARLVAELAVRAGGERIVPDALEVESLQLELARVDRQIQAARAEGRGDVSDLAVRRGEIKRAVDEAYDRVLEAGGGGRQ
jgi:DNA primase